MIRVISWNNGESARALSAMISNGKLVSRSATSPIPSCDFLVNLGCSSIGRPMRGGAVINNTSNVGIASSKRRAFQGLEWLTPWSTTDKEAALFKCIRDNVPIVCRTVDNGHSGEGIVVLDKAALLQAGDLPTAHLYVQGIQKRREYRVHVGCVLGQYKIIDVCRKVRRSGVPDDNRPFVWNHGNDFIFQRSGVNPDTVPSKVTGRAVQAVTGLGLHFGAVDVIVERGGPLEEANVYVLEVNTAPGMEGTTLERYAEYFNGIANRTPFECWLLRGEFGNEYNF